MTSAVHPVWCGAHAAPGVAVEVLVEEDQVLPVRIVRRSGGHRRDTGAGPCSSGQEDPRQPRARSRRATCLQVMQPARSGRALDPERRRRRSGGTAPAPRRAGSSPGTTPDRASSSCRRRGRVSDSPGAYSTRNSSVPSRRRRTGGPCGTGTASAMPYGREELVFVEQVAQHALEPLLGRDAPGAGGRDRRRPLLHVGDVLGQVLAVLEEPRASASRTRASRSMTSASRTSTAISGISPTMERTLSGLVLAVDVELVVVEAVLLVPEARAAERVHGVGDRDEVLEELGGDVLVGGIVPRQLERHGQHRRGSRTPSTPCRRPARGARRWAAASSGRTRRCCRGRGSRRRRGACRRRPCG